jgi:GNAT superfamily N-acetyltransferase
MSLSMMTLVEASAADSKEISRLIELLLIELEPEIIDEIQQMDLKSITKELLKTSKIRAILAKYVELNVGVLTLHECAAIYAGGVYGEISELFVLPEFRSKEVGHRLIEAAINLAQRLGWKRLEVGTPPSDKWPRTLSFYKKEGFELIGERLRYPIISETVYG